MTDSKPILKRVVEVQVTYYTDVTRALADVITSGAWREHPPPLPGLPRPATFTDYLREGLGMPIAEVRDCARWSRDTETSRLVLQTLDEEEA